MTDARRQDDTNLFHQRPRHRSVSDSIATANMPDVEAPNRGMGAA